jgi:hypothetical protein
MSNRPITDVFDVTPRFLRSTNLERDFHDPHALENYILTPHGRGCLSRLAKGLRRGATERAWRITGDYGSGKSSFALMLAHWFSGNARRMKGDLGTAINYDSFHLGERPKFLPVLITGSREPMGRAILRAVVKVMDEQYVRGGRAALVADMAQAVDSGERIDDADTVRWVLRSNAKLVKDGKAGGMLLLLDELGKFLEYAAYHPQLQDVYLLQKLAEATASSDDCPLFVVGLLHQGFNAYADHLGPAVQREWEKIAGRFEEIVFNQPLLQTAELIGAALRVRESLLLPVNRQEVTWGLEAVQELGWLGSNRMALPAGLAVRLFPLHPTILPALIRTFTQFGQNERSLFSFLLSGEPFGLQNFSTRPLTAGNTYRLPDFYDYVRATFGHRLSVHNYRSHWTEIESMVESFATSDETELKIVKTVGMLNLLDQTDLLPTDQALEAALGGPGGVESKKLRAAISHLQMGRRVLFKRGVTGSYRLWSHTSVDLQAAYEKATKAVGKVRRVGQTLTEMLATHPIVARRHYIQSGNLRYFAVRYCAVDEIEQVAVEPTEADGLIIVALCETQEECDAAAQKAKSKLLTEAGHVLLAAPTDPLSNHAGLVAESLRWNWVALNTPELNGDPFARNEMSRQKQAAATRLERRIQDLLGLRSLSGALALRWYRGGKTLPISTPRQLLGRLSDICDKLYPEAPLIANELVNRRSLSSAAAAARMRLIERIFTDGNRELLGMEADKRPPERSMYLSILQRGQLHRGDRGGWRLAEPTADDPCRLLPLFSFIRTHLEMKGDARTRVSDLFALMEQPPFGIRAGLAPLLLAIYVAIHPDEFAIYEENTFLAKVRGEEFMRMSKVPESFELQLCGMKALRADVFESLLRALDLGEAADKSTHILNIVRPLCLFVAKHPDYTRNTHRLTEHTRAVRDIILAAKDPTQLLFNDLPVACGLKAFPITGHPNRAAAQDYSVRLRKAMDEIGGTYSRLLQRMQDGLRRNFGLTGSLPAMRERLAVRVESLVVFATEPRLKAICLRFADRQLADEAWLESLGSLVVQTPPGRWKDIDEDAFEREIMVLGAKFTHLESIHFDKRARGEWAEAFRLALTCDDGNEAQEVFFVEKTELNRVDELAAELQTLLAKNRRMGMAALSKVVWQQLGKK